MLDSQTKPALLQLEVELADDDEHSIAGELLLDPCEPCRLCTVAPAPAEYRRGWHQPAESVTLARS
jgi:hypothetical protein